MTNRGKTQKPGTALGAPLPSTSRALKVAGLAEQLKLESAGKPLVSSITVAHSTTQKKVVGLSTSKGAVQTYVRGIKRASLKMGIDDYVANNGTLYDAAYAGFIAGAYFSKELTNASESLYEGIVAQAVLYAQALDTAIPPGSPVTGQATFIGNLSQSVFANKYSVDLPESAFAVYASAIAALYQEAASGFVESGGGGGGVTTPQRITHASPSKQIVCSGQDQSVSLDTSGGNFNAIAPSALTSTDGQVFSVEDVAQSWGTNNPGVDFLDGNYVQDPQNPSAPFIACPAIVSMVKLNGSSASWILYKDEGVWKLP